MITIDELHSYHTNLVKIEYKGAHTAFIIRVTILTTVLSPWRRCPFNRDASAPPVSGPTASTNFANKHILRQQQRILLQS
jgi:hypothetical protein